MVHGDARSLCIARASVVAKVTRDRLLDALGTLAPAGVSVLGLDFEGLDVRICGVSRRLGPLPSAQDAEGLFALAADCLRRAAAQPPDSGVMAA